MSEIPRKPCPICGKVAVQRYRPFCSKRCADIDLNRWLSGVYAIPAEEAGEGGKQAEHDSGESGKQAEQSSGEGSSPAAPGQVKGELL